MPPDSEIKELMEEYDPAIRPHHKGGASGAGLDPVEN